MNVPKRYENSSVSTLPENLRKAIDLIRKDTSKGIFIHGGPGTGKTYALYAMAKSYGLKVENWIDLIEDIKTCMSTNQSIGNLISEVCSAKALAIDDVGTEKQTDYTQEKFYMIVNKMYNRMNRLFISTNLTLAEFQEKYGERLFSRIGEMCEIVELTGEDKRIK